MRNAMMAVLLLGPQYGLQLRTELKRRSDDSLVVNSGQVYQTLERLFRDSMVQHSGTTPDGLPLYSLTEEGLKVAREWISTPSWPDRHPWEKMITQVLIVRSLPGIDSGPLIDAYEEIWQEQKEDLSAESGLLAKAKLALAETAIEWLSEVRLTDADAQSLPGERPARGRPKAR